MLSASFARGAQGPPGKTIYVGCDPIDVSIFESEQLVRSREKAKPVVLFDPSKVPSGHKSPYVERANYRQLRIVRPLKDASFPRNIAAPKFRWHDATSNLWMLSVTASGWSAPLRVVTNRREWRPNADTWDHIKESGTGTRVDLEIRGCRMENGQRSGETVYVDRTRFRVSALPADPIVVYRLVSPLFHGYKTPDIFYRDITTFDTRMFLPGVKTYCTNCHSFPSGPRLDPKNLNLAIAVRQQTITDQRRRILGLYNFASRQGKTLDINSFFMSWNPEGTKVAVTSGKAIFSLPLITLETQEFYVLGADIRIVDAETLASHALPGASEPEYMESFPTWTPDGKTIIFARAPELRPHQGPPRAKFDLYRVLYNNGRGGNAEPIVGASRNGMSNFAPRYSPDGKWIVFNKADWATLVKPTADLWILSTKEGSTPRKLECNTPYAMDSHHAWSSNSRWLAYTSKREDGIFSKIYFTEIDEQGHASPPVEMPTLRGTMLCYNIPEFLETRVPIDAMDILEETSTLKK